MLQYNTFIGRDLQEAIGKMKRELGPEAVMIKQRVVNLKSFLGLFKHPMVEVVGFRSDKLFLKQNKMEKGKKLNPEEGGIQKELSDIKNQLALLSESRKQEPSAQEKTLEDNPFTKYLKLLKNNDISEELADKIIEVVSKEVDINNLEDNNIILEKIKHKLIDTMEVVNPLLARGKSPRIFMFVGPTGVGKTTTMVKLAANYKLKEEKEVEIYSLDNYRFAAAEQLKSYSEIMQIPFKKFENKSDFKNTIKKSSAEIILIDTAGRSPKDEISISAIKDYIKSCGLFNIETFLVISATTKKSDLLNIHDKYSMLNYKYLIFTKLDETVNHGSIIDILYQLKKPVTYVTFGQDVPKHISLANPGILAESILKE